jgi:uncharacterized protein YutE (UPF0331/DUF86 family)
MDTTPIVARLGVIANSVNALKDLQELTYDEFAVDHILHASAERHFQVAIQAALDIGGMLLAEVSPTVPANYADIFLQLADIGVLPLDFAQKIVGMAKFRNVLVHLYLEVDLQKVYYYLQHDLEDFDRYMRYVSEYLAGLEKQS